MRAIQRTVLMAAAVCGLVSVTWADVTGDELPADALAPAVGLSVADLDALVVRDLEAVSRENQTAVAVAEPIDDLAFLRRLSLDLLGRQPTLQEITAFLGDDPAVRRAKWIDARLKDDEFGRNWAAYWSDTIASRVPPPELTFLNYGPFRAWLAARLNENAPWNKVVGAMLVGTGKIKDSPEASFIGFHEGNPTRLATETARIFMSTQIGCAECHDHPFDHWKREQFHALAAYFARTSVKMPWNDSGEIVIKDREKGEYEMPNAVEPSKKGSMMTPAFLTGPKMEKGKSDLERRRELAALLTDAENPWFARAFVNRVWSRLMGRGFYDPIDDLSDGQVGRLAETHAQLTRQFVDSGMNVKELFRLIVSTNAYRRRLAGPSLDAESMPFQAANTVKLRGDEVWQSLETAVGLADVRPPQQPASAAVRFPPPPKSTRDVVSEVFGYDPSLPAARVSRTLSQAMLMMNSDELLASIDFSGEPKTELAQALHASKSDDEAIDLLYAAILARRPVSKERTRLLEHLSRVGSRPDGWTDIAWTLVNSAEFTVRR